jgi:sugar/nucleoside kinase (ribokinase family)
MTPEALVAGRVALDLCPERAERRLEDGETFRQCAGGIATNVAIVATRRSCSTAMPRLAELEAFRQ